MIHEVAACVGNCGRVKPIEEMGHCPTCGEYICEETDTCSCSCSRVDIGPDGEPESSEGTAHVQRFGWILRSKDGKLK